MESQGTAGGIGHVRTLVGTDVACHCGNFGCLEAIAGAPAIIRRVNEAGLPIRNTSDLIDATRRSKVEAIRAVRQAGRDIGEVLSTCVSLFNPEIIVIGGSLSSAGEHLIAGVREVVYGRSTPLASENLTIVQSRDSKGEIVGAAVMAIDHALDDATIDQMLESDVSRQHQRNIILDSKKVNLQNRTEKPSATGRSSKINVFT